MMAEYAKEGWGCRIGEGWKYLKAKKKQFKTFLTLIFLAFNYKFKII